MSRNLVFFGNEIFSHCPDYRQTPILSGLLDGGWPVTALIIKTGLRQRRQPASWPVIDRAQKAGIEVIRLKDSRQLTGINWNRFNSRLGIVASFGSRLPNAVIGHFQAGLVNIHPSLLPRHRGPSPIEASLLAGDDQTGVSLMQLTSQLDSGPVYDQQPWPVEPAISKLELTRQLARLAQKMLLDRLEAISQGQLTGQKQNHDQASYSQVISHRQRHINWHQPAVVIERQIRAYAGWPGSYLISRPVVKIIQAGLSPAGPTGQVPGTVSFDKNSRRLTVSCHQSALELYRLQVANKAVISGVDFYNGYSRLLAA